MRRPRSEVFRALETGRERVANALAVGATSGPEPDEETLSWILQASAAWSSERVTVRSFTRHEENRYTGADWMWWWVGAGDEWFGSLVQAKRLRRSPDGLSFGAEYRPRSPEGEAKQPTQLARLIEASDRLGVPAVYALYRTPAIGAPDAWACASIRPDLRTSAVSVVPAAIVHESMGYSHIDPLDSLRPVECLACEGTCGDDLSLLAWYSKNLADPAIRQILRAPPSTAARRAFRALFRSVVDVRVRQMRGSSIGDPDQTHAGLEIGAHFVRGFQRAPWYVGSALSSDEDLSDDVPDGVAGVVVITNS